MPAQKRLSRVAKFRRRIDLCAMPSNLVNWNSHLLPPPGCMRAPNRGEHAVGIGKGGSGSPARRY